MDNGHMKELRNRAHEGRSIRDCNHEIDLLRNKHGSVSSHTRPVQGAYKVLQNLIANRLSPSMHH